MGGSAQYHVALPSLSPGVYELKASLRLTAAGVEAQQERLRQKQQQQDLPASEDDAHSSVITVIEVRTRVDGQGAVAGGECDWHSRRNGKALAILIHHPVAP